MNKVPLCHKCIFFEPSGDSKSSRNCNLLCITVTKRPNICIKDKLKVRK